MHLTVHDTHLLDKQATYICLLTHTFAHTVLPAPSAESLLLMESSACAQISAFLTETIYLIMIMI